jgi:hypothetical protein
VLAYLARYTHRVPITNSRLVRIAGEEVAFTWKDYADSGRLREMTLPGEEFRRRFLLHVLPDRFVRIRYYGPIGATLSAVGLRGCLKSFDITC